MFNRAIVLSCALVAGSAGALTGCASPSDVSSAVQGAAQQGASTAEDASSNVANDAADWYHQRGFVGRARAEFRRDVRRDERRDIRRDASHVAARRVGWWERARAYWHRW